MADESGNYSREQRPAFYAAVTGALSSLLTSGVAWWLYEVGELHDDVVAWVVPAGAALAALVGRVLGKIAQRLTYPAGVVEAAAIDLARTELDLRQRGVAGHSELTPKKDG